MLKRKIDVWRWEPGTHPVNRPKTSHRRYLRTQLQKRNFNCETWHVHYAPDWQSQRRQFEWQQRKNFQLTNAEVYLLTLSDFVSFSLLLSSRSLWRMLDAFLRWFQTTGQLYVDDKNTQQAYEWSKGNADDFSSLESHQKSPTRNAHFLSILKQNIRLHIVTHHNYTSRRARTKAHHRLKQLRPTR